MGNETQDNWVNHLRKVAGESEKKWSVAIILSFFLGMFGVDRFYLNYIGLGILKMITFGGFGIWWLLDLILILIGKMKDRDGGTLVRPFS